MGSDEMSHKTLQFSWLKNKAIKNRGGRSLVKQTKKTFKRKVKQWEKMLKSGQKVEREREREREREER